VVLRLSAGEGGIPGLGFLLRTSARAGLLRPSRPDRVARSLLALVRVGTTRAAGYSGGAARYPRRRAIVDELGTLTFAEVDRRTNALANAFARHGIGAGQAVAIMCRNHRGFIEASVACSKLGAHALYLNTSFAAPLAGAVVQRENPVAVVYDQEFTAIVEEACAGRRAFVAWLEDRDTAAHPSLEDVIVAAPADIPHPPSQAGRTVILTSCTTGPPHGPNRLVWWSMPVMT